MSQSKQHIRAGQFIGAKRGVMNRWGQILSCLYYDKPPTGWDRPVSEWKPTAEKFRRAFGLKTYRTILRDFAAIKDAGYDIQYDARDGAWRWNNKENIQGMLPTIAMTEEELLAMLSALFMSHSMLDSTSTHYIETFLKKQADLMPGGFAHSASDIAACLSYKSHYKRPARDLWTHLQRAILEEKLITFKYESPWDESEPRKRQLIPLHMALIDGAWYLYGLPKDSADNTIRTYRLSRMTGLQVKRRAPKHCADVEALRQSIRTGIGPFIAYGSKTQWVKLKMSSRVLRFMQEYEWEPAPRITDCNDGTHLFEIQVAAIEDTDDPFQFHPIIPFILSWLPHVEVIAPPALRLRIARITGTARQVHS